MKLIQRIFYISFLTALVGCSTVTEPVKLFLGVSTKALQDARSDAIKGKYLCNYKECYEAVLGLARGEEPLSIETEKHFDVFRQNRKKGFIIVMGVKGQVDTTEVGIFFSYNDEWTTAIDVSSLSSPAKKKVATAVFNELDRRFEKAE